MARRANDGSQARLMFGLTFVSIGVVTGFSKLRGLGRQALLYGLALVVVIARIADIVAWIFHHGMMLPLVPPGG